MEFMMQQPAPAQMPPGVAQAEAAALAVAAAQQQQNNLFLGMRCDLMNRFRGSGGRYTTTLPPDPGSSEK
jgi:hypothetical protein